jgi:hypothetical protein
MSDPDIGTAPPTAATARPSDLRPVRTQRAVQIGLAFFWILDAALQFQPFMFSKGFVQNFILANAGGQPTPLRWVITNVGNFLLPHIAVWNTFFALVQLAIGTGLLLRRTVRPALVLSFVWVLGVWVFGEGLGGLLTGSASALTGAPGSVVLYGVIGLLAWPRAVARMQAAGAAPAMAPGAGARERGGDLTGVASSAAAQGVGGATGALAVWGGYWIVAAVLFVMPNNRTPTSIASAISGMAPGNPSWYAHFLNSVANRFASSGTQVAWVLAIASVLIGLGPLLARRPTPYLVAGGALSVAFWVTGQGLLGGILTGNGTDPNTGPLIVLLALALAPVPVVELARLHAPLAPWLSRRPVLLGTGAMAVILALILSAAYPAPPPESAATAMGGMVGMAGSGGSSSAVSAVTASCTTGNSRSTRAGLDVNNTPFMAMSANGVYGMNMNGADASAAAGYNTVKANWSYTGPPLPQAEARELLADGRNGPADIHMAATGCAAQPTYSQQINEEQYVQATSGAVARDATPAAAVAAGYVAVSPTNYPVVYYVNPTIEAANAAAHRTLRPSHVDGLVFATTPSGQSVLAAAMYVLPSTISAPPMPYGALVQWHQRTSVCGPTGGSGTALDITGTAPCGAGSTMRATPYLTMVWQIPVAGGPTAIQPPDIQIVEAAVMQEAT